MAASIDSPGERRFVVRWILIVLVALASLSALALWSWGKFASQARGEASAVLPVTPDGTRLDRLVAPLLARQEEGASGAALLDDATQAFVARALTARAAERSLDVQYYIWRHDLTGKLLEHELMAAAERGVRVRLLIDDMNVGGLDDALRAMDAHPNLEVRLFNPARTRAGGFRRAIEMGLRFGGFNRRMHNKAWIADGRVALVGGRNVGDEYFDAAEDKNFQDADLLLLGPAVAQAGEVFDAFWNSAAVVPLDALHDKPPRWTAEAFVEERRRWLAEAASSPWLKALAEQVDLGRILGSAMHGDAAPVAPEAPATAAQAAQAVKGLTLHWSPSIRVVSDPPEKASSMASERDRAGWLLYDVMALLFSASATAG